LSPSPTATAVSAEWPHPPAAPRVPADILNATITVPAFAAKYPECPHGARKFTDGVSPIDSGAALNIHPDVTPVLGDLDGVAGDETLVVISCDTDGSVHLPLLVALKPRSAGGWTTLGSVLPAPYFFDEDNVTVANRSIAVELIGPYQNDGGWTADKQLRQYRLDGDAFHQVGGPTTFPPLPAKMSTVDVRNVGIELPLNQFACTSDCAVPLVLFHNGGSTQWVRMWQHEGADYRLDSAGGLELTFSIASTAQLRATDGHLIVLAVVRWEGAGYRSAAVFAVDASNNIPFGTVIAQSGADGASDILGIAVSGSAARVTVATADGQQTRTYQQKAGTNDGYNHLKWARTG
jgi:hypothetical protein